MKSFLTLPGLVSPSSKTIKYVSVCVCIWVCDKLCLEIWPGPRAFQASTGKDLILFTWNLIHSLWSHGWNPVMALVKWPFHPSDWCSACHPVSHPAARVPRVGICFPRLPSGCASQEESPAFKQAYSFQVASRSSRVFNLQNVVLLFDLSSKLELLIGPFFCCCFFF